MHTPSLLRRTVTANTLIALAVVTTAGIGAYWTLSAMLHDALDDALADRAALAQQLSAQEDDQSLAERLAQLGIRARLKTPTGDVHLAEPVVPRVSRIAVPSTGSGRTRTAVHELPSGSTLTLELSTEGVDRTLARFRTAAIAIGLGAVAAVALLASAAHRFTHAPLRSMAAIARSITAGTTDARANPDDATTEIGQVAAAFDEMVDHIQATTTELAHAEAASRQLVSDVAHQLRTPLTGVLTTTEMLLNARDGLDQRELLEAAHRSAQRSAAISERLLTLASHELPPSAPATCDVVAIARSLTDVTRSLNPHLRVELRAPGPPVLAIITAEELEDALGNILDNAARHAASHILVTITPDGDAIAITVADDGAGVAPEQARHVFDRFASLDGKGGTGLGLAIARAAAERRGGHVTWDGQHFTIHLLTPPHD